jgi:hypothetical protein
VLPNSNQKSISIGFIGGVGVIGRAPWKLASRALDC